MCYDCYMDRMTEDQRAYALGIHEDLIPNE